jgi:hypothetical protein
MGTWSPASAIAMEKRHIVEGQERVARQNAIVSTHIERGHDRMVARSMEVLAMFRNSVEQSRERLRYLEQRYGSTPGH